MVVNGKYFVTGTSTDVGKTYVASVLLKSSQQKGCKSLGLKPIASGSVNGINDDALILMDSSNVSCNLKDVNPFCFEQAIAPHIAAKNEQCQLEPISIVDSLKPMLEIDTNLCLIEGAGGWAVPLNDKHMWSDVVQLLDVPVILVVGMTLGCINHALLTERAIKADNCVIHGWIANAMDPSMECYQENLSTLKNMMQSNFLGEIPFGKDYK
jgi:dethiobiotin synthetase